MEQTRRIQSSDRIHLLSQQFGFFIPNSSLPTGSNNSLPPSQKKGRSVPKKPHATQTYCWSAISSWFVNSLELDCLTLGHQVNLPYLWSRVAYLPVVAKRHAHDGVAFFSQILYPVFAAGSGRSSSSHFGISAKPELVFFSYSVRSYTRFFPCTNRTGCTIRNATDWHLRNNAVFPRKFSFHSSCHAAGWYKGLLISLCVTAVVDDFIDSNQSAQFPTTNTEATKKCSR